jgi:hypothetical protein
LLPVLVCRVNMPTIVQQEQGDRPKRHRIMALQNARKSTLRKINELESRLA